MDSLAIVERIEEELKARGIKKGEFYEACCISSATFSQWRHRIYMPSAENLARINAFLGLNFVIEEQKNKPTAEAMSFSEDEVKLINDYRKLTPEWQSRVKALVQQD